MSLIENNNKNNNNIITSKLSSPDVICSSFIDFNNPRFVVIDGMFYTTLIVISYQREMESLFLDKLLNIDIDVSISMYYNKQNTYEVIKELTYTIGNVGASIKTSNDNQQDIEVVGGTYGDAKAIRKQLQVGDEELFYVSIQIGIYSYSQEQLESDAERIESIAISCGLNTIRANYRQEEAFKSTIPFVELDNDIENISSRNVLTSGLVSTYPFVSNELFDRNGILIGINAFDKSILMLDRFDSTKYKNANMFVVGTSGSGKSYFVKLMINRNRFLNISQFVIDPDREYIKLCSSLQGALINFGAKQVINVFDIRECNLEAEESYLLNKISKLKVFFSIIFGNISLEEEAVLENALIECYKQKGITEENNSLYEKNEKSILMGKRIFKTSEKMPKIEDLYELLKKEKKMKKYCTLLKPFLTGTLKYLNNYTNVDYNNKLVVVDIHEVSEQDLPLIMFIVTDYFWDLTQKERSSKKIIYLDEVWKLINQNKYTAEFVFKLFKTIRKYGGGATAITQDVTDFFALDDGKYGKGIINNSSIKCFFQLEENDVKVLENVVNISEDEKYRLINMKRGTSIVHADKNAIMIDVISTKIEHERITTDRDDLEKQMEVG